MKGALIVLVILLSLVAVFAVQNPGIIVVRFLGASGYTSLLVVIVVSFAAGVAAAGLVGLPGIFRRRSEAAAAARRIRELESEIDGLKRSVAPAPPEKTP